MHLYFVQENLPTAGSDDVVNRFLFLGSRTICVFMLPEAAGGTPFTIAMYSFFTRFSWNCFWSQSSLSLFFAVIMTPDVSLSRRWTIPGRRGSLDTAAASKTELQPQWNKSAFTSVPDQFPAAGWVTMPCFLLMTAAFSSSYRISSGISCGRIFSGTGSSYWISTFSPPETFTESFAFFPSTTTDLIPCLSLERLICKNEDAYMSKRHDSPSKNDESTQNEAVSINQYPVSTTTESCWRIRSNSLRSSARRRSNLEIM